MTTNDTLVALEDGTDLLASESGENFVVGSVREITVVNPELVCVSTPNETNTGLRCEKTPDANGDIFLACVKSRFLYRLGSNSGAYLPAITVCNQKVF